MLNILFYVVDIPEWLWVFFKAPLEHDHKLKVINVMTPARCLFVYLYLIQLL